MRQRVLIAAAFALEPKLIVADEPTTALDVTVQKQILRLIREMQRAHGTAVLFVTHDLGVVAKICQNVTVLYAGKVVEEGRTAELFAAPSHAYTRALLAATPRYTDPLASLQAGRRSRAGGARGEIAAADRRLGGAMSEPLFKVRGLEVALPDMARKPLIGRRRWSRF